MHDNGAENYLKFLQGSDEAFVELIRAYKDGLILFLLRYVGDIHLAEELTEDTFFKLLSRKPRFEHRSSFKTWLYTIAHNTAIDYIRHTHRELPTADMQQSLPGADMETLERAYLKADQKIMVHRMLARLDPRHAQVLHLCYFEELDYTQIGQIMHLSTRQVTNLLYRARQKLKTELEKAGFEYEEQ